MVLELMAPHEVGLAALRPLLPVFLSYVLSFIYIGIYWNNHHHLFHAVQHVSGSIMWANLHLLFWQSLIPFVTAWMGENHFAAVPTALYGAVLLMSAVAYTILQGAIIAKQGRGSLVAGAVGRDRKGKLSLFCYVLAIGLAFVDRRLAGALYVFVAVMWLVPDRRIERVLERRPG
jgi:uncharacterized membrane protein